MINSVGVEIFVVCSQQDPFFSLCLHQTSLNIIILTSFSDVMHPEYF